MPFNFLYLFNLQNKGHVYVTLYSTSEFQLIGQFSEFWQVRSVLKSLVFSSAVSDRRDVIPTKPTWWNTERKRRFTIWICADILHFVKIVGQCIVHCNQTYMQCCLAMSVVFLVQEMRFPKTVLNALKKRGISKPTPIQIQGLPVVWVLD